MSHTYRHAEWEPIERGERIDRQRDRARRLRWRGQASRTDKAEMVRKRVGRLADRVAPDDTR